MDPPLPEEISQSLRGTPLFSKSEVAVCEVALALCCACRANSEVEWRQAWFIVEIARDIG